MEVVVFLPGILGSELRTADDRKVWPPDVSEAISELAQWKIDALLDETPLKAPTVVEKVCLKNIYRGFLRDLEDAGFTRNGTGKRLELMPYDWRLDLLEVTAPDIANRLDALVADGATRIHLVAHSMGGWSLVFLCKIRNMSAGHGALLCIKLLQWLPRFEALPLPWCGFLGWKRSLAFRAGPLPR
ncbi:esterase/lipase family protein [Roseobacter sp. MH60115]|uniref:esterase/lipase family protein n=1 Tax=Roseobacter sp. MH60115 TaxID=2785324 RepID=UPI0018A25D02|nr:hypothetical protein [Roseobacter sp. MH60115]